VLDPRTGWPVRDAPRSVTALAGSCTEAGLLTTMALLRGPDAEAFLEGEGVRHWCLR
jgi:thiamine biosynthesis lipoprotein